MLDAEWELEDRKSDRSSYTLGVMPTCAGCGHSRWFKGHGYEEVSAAEKRAGWRAVREGDSALVLGWFCSHHCEFYSEAGERLLNQERAQKPLKSLKKSVRDLIVALFRR